MRRERHSGQLESVSKFTASREHILKLVSPQKMYKDSLREIFRFEFRGAGYRLDAIGRPKLGDGEIYLHLGCGHNAVEGMVNADFLSRCASGESNESSNDASSCSIGRTAGKGSSMGSLRNTRSNICIRMKQRRCLGRSIA